MWLLDYSQIVQKYQVTPTIQGVKLNSPPRFQRHLWVIILEVSIWALIFVICGIETQAIAWQVWLMEIVQFSSSGRELSIRNAWFRCSDFKKNFNSVLFHYLWYILGGNFFFTSSKYNLCPLWYTSLQCI